MSQPSPVRRAAGMASRSAILERGLRLAAHGGLPYATIGRLATALGMSKSAVFAHFGSKPRLDVAIVEAAVCRFDRHVVGAAAAAPAGVARLAALTEAWLARALTKDPALDVLAASCPHAWADQRQAVVSWRQSWRARLEAQAVQATSAGELASDTRSDALAFELDALLMAALRDVEAGDADAVERARYAIEQMLRRSAAAPRS